MIRWFVDRWSLTLLWHLPDISTICYFWPHLQIFGGLRVSWPPDSVFLSAWGRGSYVGNWDINLWCSHSGHMCATRRCKMYSNLIRVRRRWEVQASWLVSGYAHVFIRCHRHSSPLVIISAFDTAFQIDTCGRDQSDEVCWVLIVPLPQEGLKIRAIFCQYKAIPILHGHKSLILLLPLCFVPI